MPFPVPFSTHFSKLNTHLELALSRRKVVGTEDAEAIGRSERISAAFWGGGVRGGSISITCLLSGNKPDALHDALLICFVDAVCRHAHWCQR